MKKKWVFVFITLIAATVLYFGSYYFFKNRNDGETPKGTVTKINKADTDEENVWGVIANSQVITKSTKIEIEYYDVKNDERVTKVLESNVEYLGLDRQGVIDYTRLYMDRMSVEDETEGLYDFQLVSFSPSKVILRKCYEKEEPKPKYVLGLKDYYIVIYYNDDSQAIFEETTIDARTLPENILNAVLEGMYFYEDNDLYNFLEAYSS